MPPAVPNWSPLEDDEQLVDIAFVPDGGRLRLIRSGDDFSILLDHHELMSTDLSSSEQELAGVACAQMAGRAGVQMLIGGYGMGFTLRAALAGLEADAEVTVAEIVPKIVEWARGPMIAVTAGCLDDPRVVLIEDDVGMLIEAASEGYDCILLDVDNGPEGLTRRCNDWLYSADGLVAARNALRPEGLLAIWSAAHDDRFAGRLARSGFAVRVIEARHDAHWQGEDDIEAHVIILAHKIP
ncbi:spermidine synthase [Croceicoccus mobilis]|uniref:Spermidine synthase n=2 Tax=Croceicoccus mobilis TaxID=1703339 RepID=A0A916Z4V6_9SPHN|nr:spermidine synthase [Croceicoccus mobilis]GGD74581.1 spermidine synthase [Croceicoccus mobilis]